MKTVSICAASVGLIAGLLLVAQGLSAALGRSWAPGLIVIGAGSVLSVVAYRGLIKNLA